MLNANLANLQASLTLLQMFGTQKVNANVPRISVCERGGALREPERLRVDFWFNKRLPTLITKYVLSHTGVCRSLLL